MNSRNLVGVLILATILAVIIRMFLFETIRITTPSMSENQNVGDRLIIEKWSIGSRLPFSLSIPFVPDTILGKKTYFRIAGSYVRLPGIRKIKRNDLLEFNYPAQTDNRPIDQFPVLLSRCVGLPGEYICLKGTELLINDKKVQRNPDVCVCYRYPIKQQKEIIKRLNSEQINRKTYQDKDSGFIYLTRYQYLALTKSGKVLDFKSHTFSFDEKSALIPFEGFRIKMDNLTFDTWAPLINRFEGIHLRRTADGHFIENARVIEYYTFKQNYYWLLNDHQGYVDDSRSFGLIPESYIIGKACLIFFSPNKKRFLQKI